MTRETIRLLARICFWLAAILAYVMALIPGGEPALQFRYDKANHILAFVTLAALARLGWSRGQGWIIVVLLIAFGGFIEICQALPLIHRDPSWSDFFADAVATMAGFLVGWVALLFLRGRTAGRE